MNKVELEAKKLQAEAVDLLCQKFKIDEDLVSGAVVRAVECIVLAATLNTMAWMSDAAQEQE